MLTQTETLACKDGSLTLEQVYQHLVPQGDTLLQKITDYPTVKAIVDWLSELPSFDAATLDQFRLDSLAVFVGGDNHSHLITFWRGCHTLLFNFDQQHTVQLIKLLGIGI